MRVIGSHNGLAAVSHAYRRLQSGARPLDAVVEGIALVEDDPLELTVGYGGLPNENGIVELDAAVMDGRLHRGAGVAALRNVRHPTQVAQRLMEQTNRVLLVGEGALAFARANGFPEENLLTERARTYWLHWKRIRSQLDDWLPPAEGETAAEIEAWFRDHYRGAEAQGKVGTVHVGALDATRNLACATSTSGHAFKLPGRVGDSPILGAGLYADNDAGSCGSIGHGESNLENCTSFAAVELLRQGLAPREAGLQLLARIAQRTHPHLRRADGKANFNLWLFILAQDGRYAGVSLWPGKEFAIADEQGARLEPCPSLYAEPR